MKRFLCALLACLLLILPALAEEEESIEDEYEEEYEEETATGSWSQINQAVGKGEGWEQVGTDGRFHLGEKQPLEGYDGLYIMDWGTWPSMDGSTVCVPMAMELARQWLGLEEGDMNGFVSFSTTPYAYDRLTGGKPNPLVTIKSQGVMMDDTHPIDLVLATYPNADERRAAAEAGVELVYVPFCYDAFVFMVNEANPVDSLTVAQIREIYTGQHKTWAGLGGTAQTLYAYQRPHGSGSQTAMEEMVMTGLEIAEAEDNYISDGMADAVRQIGNYDNGPGAIGYSYLYYVNTLVESSGVKALAVDGVAPTDENLQSGAYPFTVNYYAVYRKGDANTEAFVNWLVGEEGQRAVEQAGYIPLR
jgi:phosphate transport system substrate-binding protein